MAKTEFILEVKETDGDMFNVSINANGSRVRLNLYLVNAMLQNKELREIITSASEQYKELIKEQRKRSRKK